MLNKHDRFFLEFQKQRVIETDSESSHRSSSDECRAAGRPPPYAETEKRTLFLRTLHKYLAGYEEGVLKESQRRILLGVQTAQANLLDRAIHEKKLKREKLLYKKKIRRSFVSMTKNNSLLRSTTADVALQN